MKIAWKIFNSKQRGFAILMTVVFIGIALLLLAGFMAWASGSSLQTERNNLYRSSTGAADAATELAMAYMWRDFYNQTFSTASNYSGYMPAQDTWPVRFSFSNGSGVKNETEVISTNAGWESLSAFGATYTNLSAFVDQCTVKSMATTTNQPYEVSATVEQQFQLAAIPIFQWAVFYNLNMEIDPGNSMTLKGPVFSNDGIWARGLNTYDSTVSAVGVVSTNSTDPFMTGKSDSGGSTFSQTPATNQNSLTLPIGTNNTPAAVQALLGLPPAGTAPYSDAGQVYFANEANIIVSNSPSGKLTAFFQDPDSSTPLTQIPYDAGTNTYSFATNVNFYDFRENKTVDAVQLDVHALNTWMTNGGGVGLNNKMELDNQHYIDSVYIYNGVQENSSTLPGARVVNGAALPTDGLTVVTPDPLYVLGNYNAPTAANLGTSNVVNTAPAALIGDAITVLSSSWSDKNDTPTGSGNTTGNRPPVATTVNAATFEGIVQSNGANYSGGVENFLRLLEDWGKNNTVLTYNGSIVVMFPSKYATNYWDNNNYYSVPKRNWSFDLNFLSQNGIPPLTPEVRAIIRQSWAVVN